MVLTKYVKEGSVDDRRDRGVSTAAMMSDLRRYDTDLYQYSAYLLKMRYLTTARWSSSFLGSSPSSSALSRMSSSVRVAEALVRLGW